MAPFSKMGSLEGENSRSKLHKVDDARTMQSVEELGDSRIDIKGSQTGWS